MIKWLALLGLAAAAYGQAPEVLWMHSWPGQEGYSVAELEDEGLMLSGVWFRGEGNPDGCVIRTDADGDALWTAFCGGDRVERVYGLTLSPQGGAVVAGHTYTWAPEGNPNAFVAAFDSSGRRLWQRNYGDWLPQEANCILPSGDGGYVVTGGCGHLTGNFIYWDFYWLCIDAEGNFQRESRFGGAGSEYAYALAAAPDGGWIMAGSITDWTDNPDTVVTSDFYLVKVDPDGTLEWSRRYGGPEFEMCYGIASTRGNGYLLVGWTDSFSAGGSGDCDVWALRVDENGDSLWARRYGGPSVEYAYSVAVVEEGGFVIGGSTQTWGEGLADFWLVRVDENGDSLWSMTFGGAGWDQCWGLVPVSDGGLVMVGGGGGEWESDIWLVKAGGRIHGMPADKPPLPLTLGMVNAFPNPFNGNLAVKVALSRAGFCRVQVLDVTGAPVATVFEGDLTIGEHRFMWAGKGVPAGTYILRADGQGRSSATPVVFIP